MDGSSGPERPKKQTRGLVVPMDRSRKALVWVRVIRRGWASVESDGKASSFVTIIRKPG